MDGGRQKQILFTFSFYKKLVAGWTPFVSTEPNTVEIRYNSHIVGVFVPEMTENSKEKEK